MSTAERKYDIRHIDQIPTNVMDDIVSHIQDSIESLGDYEYLPFRLRLYKPENSYTYELYLHIGSPQYDTDHRGHVGDSAIHRDESTEEVESAVEYALDGIRESKAQSQAHLV